jgi:hypothetical protein
MKEKPAHPAKACAGFCRNRELLVEKWDKKFPLIKSEGRQLSFEVLFAILSLVDIHPIESF